MSTLLLPEVFYGQQGAVRRRTRKFWRSSLAAGEADFDVFTPLLEVHETSGRIVLNHPNSLSGTHFFVEALGRTFLDVLSGQDIDELILSVCHHLFSAPWGVLAASTPSASVWLMQRRSIRMEYLQQTLRHWNDIHSTGARFYGLAPPHCEFWALQTNLQVAVKQESGRIARFENEANAREVVRSLLAESEAISDEQSLRGWLLATLKEKYGELPSDLVQRIESASAEELDRWAGWARAYPHLQTFMKLAVGLKA